jgi:hypothetical protein
MSGGKDLSSFGFLWVDLQGRQKQKCLNVGWVCSPYFCFVFFGFVANISVTHLYMLWKQYQASFNDITH